MKLPPLVEGTLIRRYKRFLADVRLEDGREVTAHCPNPGSMASCMKEGGRVLLSESDDPKRKLRHSWELSRMGRTWVLINTSRVNRVAQEGLEAGAFPALPTYTAIRPEASPGPGTRFDFRLDHPGKPPLWVEVKSATLRYDGVSYFPDAVTLRGQKHLVELVRRVEAGERAALLFLVSRGDTARVRPAAAIDPDYAEALAWAREQGVLVLAHRCKVGRREIRVAERLPVEVGSPHSGPLPRGKKRANRAKGSWKKLREERT